MDDGVEYESIPPIALGFNDDAIRDELAEERPELSQSRSGDLHRSPLALAFAERVDGELRAEAADREWRTEGYDGGGTGGAVLDLVMLAVNQINQAAPTVATWLGIATSVLAFKSWAERRTHGRIHVDETAAKALAYKALHDHAGPEDFSCSFVIETGSRPEPRLPDGWAIGLRSDTHLWVVLINYLADEEGIAVLPVAKIRAGVGW